MSFALLQFPKTKGFFGGFVADPGHQLVGLDFTALEPHITAYLSRDKRMLQLYGPGAKYNDIYLFYGSATPMYGAKFRELGYDPDNPTKEAIKLVKSQCGTERQVCKSLVLMFNYGGGPAKALSTLHTAGFTNLTIDDTREFHRTYWQFFSGIKLLGERLRVELRKNGGWILGIKGQPITIPKPHKYWDETQQQYVTIDYSKDIVNRLVQSSGSIINKRFIWHINNLRLNRGVPMTPFIPDYHDASYWQVEESAVDQAKQVFVDAMTLINDDLGWDVKLTGNVKTGPTMASFIED